MYSINFQSPCLPPTLSHSVTHLLSLTPSFSLTPLSPSLSLTPLPLLLCHSPSLSLSVDGTRVASSTGIDVLLLDDFKLVINDTTYLVRPPSRGEDDQKSVCVCVCVCVCVFPACLSPLIHSQVYMSVMSAALLVSESVCVCEEFWVYYHNSTCDNSTVSCSVCVCVCVFLCVRVGVRACVRVCVCVSQSCWPMSRLSG